MKTDFSKFADRELARAIELMVAPSDLSNRATMMAILMACDFSPEEVSDQLSSGEVLHGEPPLSWSVM